MRVLTFRCDKGMGELSGISCFWKDVGLVRLTAYALCRGFDFCR